MTMPNQTADRIAIDPDYGCWIWQGNLYKGYGPYREHWERLHGVILPRRVELDHVCRRRSCVNPTHLEAVTLVENQKRRFARNRRDITRCPMGHRLTPETTLHTPEDGIVCTVCERLEP